MRKMFEMAKVISRYSREEAEKKERRFCKGCHAEVTDTMHCNCGDFDLLKSETLSEEELNKLENGN